MKMQTKITEEQSKMIFTVDRNVMKLSFFKQQYSNELNGDDFEAIVNMTINQSIEINSLTIIRLR